MAEKSKTRARSLINADSIIKIALGLQRRERKVDEKEFKFRSVLNPHASTFVSSPGSIYDIDSSENDSDDRDDDVEFYPRDGAQSRLQHRISRIRGISTSSTSSSPDTTSSFGSVSYGYEAFLQNDSDEREAFVDAYPFMVIESKLKNRLNRIRGMPTIPTAPVQKASVPVRTASVPVQTICCEICGRQKPKVIQPEMNDAAVQALCKLTETQSNEIQFISTMAPKDFQEAFEYFVTYYQELQIYLDIEAVESYLQSQGFTRH